MHRALLCILLFLAAGMLFAGTTGKITGMVTDAESGENLPGVNVTIPGSGYGGVTNLEGRFLILNIPPGTYDLKFSLMGYATVTMRAVRVEIDLTTQSDARLKAETLQGEEVVVVADRPLVVRDISNSQMSIEAAKIESMPVETVRQVLSLQAGIQSGREGILVRGSSAGQTAFMMDGISLNDERSNIPYTAVGFSAVKEINVQTGGFNAEYGNLRAGLVNVITKESEPGRFNGALILRYSPPAAKHFGPSIYDPYSFFNRVYMDPAVCYTGTNNGAWDDFTRRQYPSFDGWNSYSEKTLQDNDPGNDLTPEGARRLYEWQHRRQGDIEKPDYIIDGTFGGPVPVIGSRLGHLRFLATHVREQDMFIFPLSRDNYGENYTRLKLTSDLTPKMKLVLSGLYGEVHSVSPYNWTTLPNGRVLRDQSEIADLPTATEGRAILYMPGYYSPSSIYRQVYSMQLTHMVSTRTFYDVSLQYNYSRNNTYKTSDRDTARIYQPVPGYYVDELPYGYMGYSAPSINGDRMGAWMNLGRDKSINATTNLKLDLTSQVNHRNQIKTGVQIVYNDYDIRSFTDSPALPDGWSRNMFYHVFPFRIGAYLQDKLEFQGFIANLGVRMDYSDPNGTYMVLGDYDENLGKGLGKQLLQTVRKSDAKSSLLWSPRLGVSHPITANSKLYFNYGHFTQEPSSANRFMLQREQNGSVTYLGNPNLQPEKTIQYELGYSQNLLDLFLLNIAAYYKDITNQPGWINYINVNSTVNYSKAVNNNYADIRGLELTLNKTVGRWISGFINYTYDVRTSGYFGLLSYYQDPARQRDYVALNTYQSKPRPQPYARINLDLHTPHDLGLPVLADINLNILGGWSAGAYDTYNPNDLAGIQDNVRWKDTYYLDMRLSKQITARGLQVQFYVDASNVFDFKFLNYAGFSDSYDYEFYMQSLCFSWEKGDNRGDDRIGTYRPDDIAYDPLEANPNNDPTISARNAKRKEDKSYIDNPNIEALTFLNPRDITIGLKFNF
ncbi:MAG TPA: TonB-dependent receptor [bacterium]|nr:TonB-dependent receptor [bacterium]HPR87116.1 TonB-dependent receptor [bacterium]